MKLLVLFFSEFLRLPRFLKGLERSGRSRGRTFTKFPPPNPASWFRVMTIFSAKKRQRPKKSRLCQCERRISSTYLMFFARLSYTREKRKPGKRINKYFGPKYVFTLMFFDLRNPVARSSKRLSKPSRNPRWTAWRCTAPPHKKRWSTVPPIQTGS